MDLSSFSDIETEFIKRAHTAVWCSAATLDTKNRLRSRVLHPIWEGSTGWVATGRYSLKATHLAHNPHMSLAYLADPVKPVYADCTAEWQDDMAAKQRIWDLFRSAPAPLGYDPKLFFGSVESPGFGVLRLTPWRIELFDISNRDNPRQVWRR
ncbi:MAG TPA: pyridoxamine 5'-phosphate oxidase [Blastocatellia bacterium]|nr:pyridoxamine 5'-phosphate oxidase [Blastocatellia bacterium]